MAVVLSWIGFWEDVICTGFQNIFPLALFAGIAGEDVLNRDDIVSDTPAKRVPLVIFYQLS